MISVFGEGSKVPFPVHVEMAERFASGGVLAGRDQGARARQEIERAASAADAEGPIVLDFSEVAAISVPFAEECIGTLLSGHPGGFWDDHPVVALNADEDVAETIAAALRQRRLSLLSLSIQGPRLLGGDQILEQTLEAAHQLKTFRAGDLAELLAITPQAANNRLNALVRNRVLARSRVIPTGGGKEFAYQDPSAAAMSLMSSGGTRLSGSTPERVTAARAVTATERSAATMRAAGSSGASKVRAARSTPGGKAVKAKNGRAATTSNGGAARKRSSRTAKN